jgi:hypothetical protein
LIADLGSLYCDAFSTPIALKKSSIEKHIESTKHADGSKELLQSKIRQSFLVSFVEVPFSFLILFSANYLN